jgi:hypothetical protein
VANSWGEMCRSFSIWFMFYTFRNGRRRRLAGWRTRPHEILTL